MKITISKSELLSKLRVLAKVLQSKNVLPAYDDFLFSIDENGFLTVTAGEEGGRITTNLDCQADCANLEFTANAKTLLDALKEIPEQPLILNVTPTKKCVELNCNYSNGKFSVVGKLGKEYPEMPFNDPSDSITLNASDFLYGIRQVKICCANDMLRPTINGVYFDRDLDRVAYVATDGAVLGLVEKKVAHKSERISFIIPSRYAQILSSVIPPDCGELSVVLSNSNARLEFDNYSLTFRLVEGRFPNYRAVIPHSNTKRAVIATSDLVSAIKRTSVFSNPNSLAMKLSFLDSLLIQVQDIDYSTSAEETVGYESYEGDKIQIGIKSTYLIDMLSNINSQKVVISMNKENTAVIITPDEDGDLMYLIMPMAINF